MRPLARSTLVLAMFLAPLASARAQSEPEAPGEEEAPEAPPVEAPPVEAPPREEEPPALTPPRLLEASDPEYPESHVAIGVEPVVSLHVTIEPDGTVSDAHVEHPGDPEFDDAAAAAVRTWRFEPARRAGTAIRARIRVEVRFHVPVPPEDPERETGAEPDLEHGDHSHGPEEVEPEPEPEPELRPDAEAPEPEAHFDATAEVDPLRESRRPRSASDYQIDEDVLHAGPHGSDAAHMLATAPGVYVARPEGEAVAQQIYLRGFDAEHGQDIELTALGMPLNMPSHIHGQGYADLGFIIPELVRGLRVTEGVYDPRQGDFATAGSIDLDLGVTHRGIQLRTSYGSFDTFRGLLLWAPTGERDETFAAATYRQTRGFGRSRAGASGGAIAQWVFGDRALRGRIHGSAWAARSGLAGILRRDDVEAGRVDFYGVYDDPSALAQSALSARVHLGGGLEMRGANGSFGELSAWLMWSDFRLSANYTGYTERSQFDSDWVGRGDLIEQRNEVLALGMRGRYRTERMSPFDWAHGFFELGLSARADILGQSQSLLEAPQNQTWDRRVDADVRAIDIGGYVDLDWSITDYVRVRGGFRADVLFYDIDDRLGNFIPDFRRDSYIIGFRRSALGVAAGPRATIEVRPVEPLVLSIAYGEGYRSPQARQLQDGETAPFAKVRSGDLGGRLVLGDHRELELSAAGYLTHVSDDTAFDPREGRLARLGPTTRIGGALSATVRPISWLVAAASLTYVHATLDAPPPPSIEDPDPPYRQGESLPYVPPLVVRADVRVGERLFDLLDQPVEAHLSLGFSLLSSRPLPYGLAADPVALLDLGVDVRWSAFELEVSVLNALDSRYASVEYSYASSWDRDAIGSRLPARHFAAGAPLTANVTLGVRL